MKAAADWNAIVVLKGHRTVIAAPGGSAYINSTGNPGMGTGGTGDVLTGMLAGLVAQYGRGLNTAGYAQLISFGVYLHGLAGDIAYADHAGAPLMAVPISSAHFRAPTPSFTPSAPVRSAKAGLRFKRSAGSFSPEWFSADFYEACIR